MFKESDRVWCRSGKHSYFKGTFIRVEGSEAVIVSEEGRIRRTGLEGVKPTEEAPVTPWIGD